MLNAEAAVIGMILHQPENLGRVVALGMTFQDFASSSLRKVFVEMLQSESEGLTYDLPSLGVRMRGHATELAELYDEAPVASDVEYFALEVIRASWARRLGELCARAAGQLLKREPFTEPDALEAMARQTSGELMGGPSLGRDTTRHIRDVIPEMIAEVEETMRLSAKGQRAGLSTGLQTLDRHIHGLRKGWYYVLGARTGVGKTTMGLQIASNVAHEDAGVLYFTMEMPDTDLAMKTMASEARVSMPNLLNGDLSDDECARVSGATHKLEDTGLHIDHRCRGSIDAIELAVHKLHRRGTCQLVVIDYIQQLRMPGGRFRSRADELSEISGRIKQMALDLKIPVLILAQINREAPKSTNAEPQIWQLRDSGALEQDADCIMLMHPDKDAPGTTWLTIAKNRRGETGKIKLEADLAHSRFREATYVNGTPMR